MINVITFRSSLDFVIVGPVGNGDGVLIKSHEADIGLIGFANLIYQSGPLFIDDSVVQNKSLEFTWSGSFSFNDRQSKLLLVFRHPTNKINGGVFDNRHHKQKVKAIMMVKKELDRFIENSFSHLRLLIESLGPNDECYNLIDQGQILWHLSPVILVCMSERKVEV